LKNFIIVDLLQQEATDVSGLNQDNRGDAFDFNDVKQEPDDQQFCTWMGYGDQ